MPETRTRSLAALWFADIVGYSSLSERDEDAALGLVAVLKTHVEEEVSARSGRVVKFVGDAALAVFESAGSAVETALSVRDAFQKSPEARESGATLHIGVHVGEISTSSDGDVFGDGVNTAARIQDAATPGQVLLSSFAWEGVRNRREFQTASAGQRTFKGLSRAMDLYSVDWTTGESLAVAVPAGGAAAPKTDFFSELKRRKVYRIGAAYLAVAFAALEGAGMVFPTLGLGPSVYNVLVIASLLGFPLALALAWTFDVTEAGIRRTEPVASGSSQVMVGDRWARLKAALVGAGFVVVIWAGVRAWQPLGARVDDGSLSEEPTLAVLPPEDFSPEGDYAYLAGGLHEEILHRLAQISGIRLTSRTSSSFMTGVSASDAADALGVQYVLESSIAVVQDSLILTVQLIDTHTEADEHVWSERLGRRFTVEGLFEIQQIMAERVAGALSGTLVAEFDVGPGTLPTRNLEAYNEFLRGLYHQNLFDIDNLWESKDHLERAIQLDPEFGRAHAQLARLLAMLNNYGGVTQGSLFPEIKEHAELALEYAPDDPSSRLAAIAYVWPMEWDWERARELYEEALALDPSYVEAYWGLAEWQGVIAGNTERGLELLQQAFRIDPFSPVLHTVRWWILFNARRFEEGIPDLEAVLAVDPENQNAGLNLVSTLALVGREDEARALMEAWLPKIPAPRSPTLAVHLARAGDTVTAREVLQNALARKESGGSVPASGIAAAYATLGQVDEALEWLERSFTDEGGIYYLRTPDWDNVANDPRFQELWERVGLLWEYPARQ